MHFLETRNVGQIVQLTIVSLFHAAVIRVKVKTLFREKKILFDFFTFHFHSQNESKQLASIIPNYEQALEKLLTVCCRYSRESWTPTHVGKGNSKTCSKRMIKPIYIQNRQSV